MTISTLVAYQLNMIAIIIHDSTSEPGRGAYVGM
jgi:predicted RNA-binding protein YlxR (DUF448 family)